VWLLLSKYRGSEFIFSENNHLLRLFPLELRIAQGSDPAEQSDCTLHIFKLIVQVFSLLLLLFELILQHLIISLDLEALLFKLSCFLL
jgi:hypothetical protein